MQEIERSTAAKTEGVAHERPLVERGLRWSGLLPLPAFLLLHLGRELSLAMVRDVSEVVRAAPSTFSVVTAGLLVWLPLTVHCVLGLWLLTSRRRPTPPNDVAAPARLVSRVCSVVALVFIVYHARQYPLATLLAEADARDAGFRLLDELSGTSFGVPVRGGAYLIGLAACVAHAGLGVHRALLLEGLLSEGGRRVSARACAAGAAALFCIGAASVIRVASGVLLR